MKQIIIFIVSFTSLALSLKGQDVDFVSSDSPSKRYSLITFNGLKVDTIAKGTTSELGEARIQIPPRYRGLAVMANLLIENKGSINIIVNSESFKLTINDQELLFENSLENELLYHKSQDILSEQYNGTYAQAYTKIELAIRQLAEVVNLKQSGKIDMFKQSAARVAALNVDVDKLYYSKYWYFLINGLLQISIGEEGFAADMIRLSERVASEKVYVAFVEDLIMLTTQFGMDDAFDHIITHVEKSGRIEYPQGNVYDAFSMVKIKRGTIAPDISGLTPSLGKTSHKLTMLFFYEPGCDNCTEQLRILKNSYSFYEQKSTRVITISGALDEKDFLEENKSFQWKDKLCDFKGLGDGSFKEYGIIATPTIYLLDARARVLKRFASVFEVEKYIRGLE